MTFSAGSIAGHHMMHEMDVVTKVAGKLLEMQHSQYFDRSSVLRRPLKVGWIIAHMIHLLSQIPPYGTSQFISCRKLVKRVIREGQNASNFGALKLSVK